MSSTTDISPNDRGYLYGDGLFETVRVFEGGHVRWLDRHIERLRHSGAALGYPDAPLERAVDNLRSLPDRKPGIWRVTVTRPGEGVAFGGEGSVNVRHRPYTPPERPTLTFVEDFYHPADRLAEHKTTSFIRYVEARRRAEAAGFDDGVLVSPDGVVGEATTSNLVAVVDGRACTPPVRGILPGVTRAGVIELADSQGAPIVERELQADELRRADEIALLSAGVGVLPAKSLEGRPLDDSWSRRAHSWLVDLAGGAP